MDLDFYIRAERTPNPDSVKWVMSRTLLEVGKSAHFDEAPPRGVSSFVADLFEIDGVAGIFLGSNFVTVTKTGDAEWPDLSETVIRTIKGFAEGGDPPLGPEYEAHAAAHAPVDSEVEQRIRAVLDAEIRPMVAQDGGDVLFAGFHDGRVELYMQGACNGCPSSTATLKHGIEGRLREAIPEVEEVVAL